MLSMETLALARAYADKIKQQVGAGFTPQIVESLPTTGDSTILYLVLKEGTAPQGNIYDEYLWIDGAYEHIGDTTTIMTVDSALSATSENPVQNKVIKGELDKKIDKPANIKEGLLGFNSVGVETIKEITGAGVSVETDMLNIPNNRALKEYVAAKNVNLLSKPTSNGIVGYMSGIGSLTYTLNTSMPESPSHAGILSAKAVYDFIMSLDASEVSY